MKSLNKSVVTIFLSALIAPLFANGASVAKVVYESPDGATVMRTSSSDVSTGMDLMQGDVLETGASTVILSLCEGSLVTVYPNSSVTISSLSDTDLSLSLSKGAILEDASMSCNISVSTVVGTASIQDGVFGVLMNRMAETGWTMQVRNLDGNVKFVGDPSLDTSNLEVSLIEPNKEIEIPAGEEIIIRGTYNESAEVFALEEGGAVLAMLEGNVTGQMQTAAQEMSAAAMEFENEGAGAGGEQAPVIIEIPYEDVETASDKG